MCDDRHVIITRSHNNDVLIIYSETKVYTFYLIHKYINNYGTPLGILLSEKWLDWIKVLEHLKVVDFIQNDDGSLYFQPSALSCVNIETVIMITLQQIQLKTPVNI